MDIISPTATTTTNKQKEEFVALRNDSGYDDNEAFTENVDAATQCSAEDVSVLDFAFKWPSIAHNDDFASTARDYFDKENDGPRTYKNVATPSSLFGRTFERSARTSIADGCISPGTTTPTNNPLDTPYEVDVDATTPSECTTSQDAVLSRRNSKPLRPLQPRRKSTATVGQVQRTSVATDSESPVEDTSTVVCIEESQWHRYKPSRLLSYQSASTSSSEDFGETLTGHPGPRSPGSESPDEWMMAEDQPCPTPPPSAPPSGTSPSGSPRKSFKFVKKPKLRTRKRQSSPRQPSGTSTDSHKSSGSGSLSRARSLSAAHPSRHYSYGATLDLPPIGIQTHRSPGDCIVSQNEAFLDDADLVIPTVLPPTLRELEAQLDLRNETSPLVRRRLIGGLLVLANAVPIGATLYFLLWPKVWNESRFAIAAMPITVWLCLFLNVIQQLRHGRRPTALRFVREDVTTDDGTIVEGASGPLQTSSLGTIPYSNR